jgi:hypothetical protein
MAKVGGLCVLASIHSSGGFPPVLVMTVSLYRGLLSLDTIMTVHGEGREKGSPSGSEPDDPCRVCFAAQDPGHQAAQHSRDGVSDWPRRRLVSAHACAIFWLSEG